MISDKQSSGPDVRDLESLKVQFIITKIELTSEIAKVIQV